MDPLENQNSHLDRERDLSDGGWDTTIVKAPDRHKGGKRRHHGRGRKKIIIGVVVVIAVLAVVVAVVEKATAKD